MNPLELGTRSPATRPGQCPVPNRRLITLAEAAVLLGMSTVSVRRLIWAGKLPIVRLTRRIQIDARDLERLVDQSKSTFDF